VAAWKFNGERVTPSLIKEHLVYESVQFTTRSYK
jgi:hypothetical protein